MTEQEIFEHLFTISKESQDKDGIVAACLVRGGEVFVDGFSNNEGIHAEYAVLQKIKENNISVLDSDILYTTVIPCGKRTPGGQGEKYGDCTTNLIHSGIKTIVYGADDAHASSDVPQRFADAGIVLRKIETAEVQDRSKSIFNESVSNQEDLI